MESIKWLEIAAMGESQPPREALPRVIEVFDDDLHDYIVPPLEESLGNLSFTKPTLGNARKPTIEVDSYVNVLEVELSWRKILYEW